MTGHMINMPIRIPGNDMDDSTEAEIFAKFETYHRTWKYIQSNDMNYMYDILKVSIISIITHWT